MSILIFGGLHDVHARAVEWALLCGGHICQVIEFHEYPSRIASSARLASTGDLALETENRSGGPTDQTRFETVWNRRAGPVSVAEWLSDEDIEVASNQAQAYLNWLRAAPPPFHQFWVNPRESQVRADNKLLQLQLARRHALTIPETLVSNDPRRVREFVAAAPQAIAKPLRPAHWSDGRRRRAMPTAEIGLRDLSDARSISAAPMIFQHRVDKAFELRVVLFGAELVACRLDSQSIEEARTDFRTVDPRQLRVSPYQLACETEAALRRIARELGVVHGSFDLAVTPDGDIVFFEFNEQGQTLWLEDCNPDVRILDRLAAFLIAPSATFSWNGERNFAFADYLATEAFDADKDIEQRA